MRKKVLFVINTLGHAGAEMAMLELMKSFDPNKYELSLYVLMAQGELVHRLPTGVTLLNERFNDASVLSKEAYKNMLDTVCRATFYKANGLRLLPYLIKNGYSMLRKKRFQIDKLLWRIVSDGATRFNKTYDLAIAYLEGGASYYVADHVKAKKKVAFIHIDYGKAGYTRQLDKACYLKYDQIFTVSNEVKTHFLKTYPECESYTSIFHNFLDQEEIRVKAQHQGGFEDSFEGIRLLTVGRLTYQKAYEIAIEALSVLRKRGYNVRWYVLGEGPERERLERLIKKADLTGEFCLLGAKSNPYPYFMQTDIYVHATRFEGKSIAIQEAQTLGCAIVASNSSGNREQIEHERDGILCELNAQSIADSIIKLIESDELKHAFSIASKNRKINYWEDMQMLLNLLG